MRFVMSALLVFALTGSARGDADATLTQAQDAFVNGQYKKAIELARQAIDAQPSRAWRVIGASSCFLKDRDGAVTAMSKLDKQGQQFVRYVCKRQDIELP